MEIIRIVIFSFNLKVLNNNIDFFFNETDISWKSKNNYIIVTK